MVKNKKLLKFESSKVHQNQTFSPYKFWFPTFQQVKNLLEHQNWQYSKINFLDFLPLLSSNWTSVGLFFAISFIQSLKLVIWALCICGMSFFKSIINDITLMISKWGTSKYKCQFHNVDRKHLKVVTMKIKSLWITTVSIHNLSLGTQIRIQLYYLTVSYTTKH